jgi:hypothetical protein
MEKIFTPPFPLTSYLKNLKHSNQNKTLLRFIGIYSTIHSKHILPTDSWTENSFRKTPCW